jgi:hypothetical protein
MPDRVFRTGYAIVRYDGNLVGAASGQPELFVNVVKVLINEEEAFQEMERLNTLRRTTETEYFVSATHVYDG